MSEVIETASPAETTALGERLAGEIASGGVVFLEGPLGAGKTLFAKAVFATFGVDPRRVTSPTFQMVNRYRPVGPDGPALWHVDLYRIEHAADLESLGLDEMVDDGSVVLIEWAERLADTWLKPALRLTIEDLGSDRRRFTIVRRRETRC